MDCEHKYAREIAKWMKEQGVFNPSVECDICHDTIEPYKNDK